MSPCLRFGNGHIGNAQFSWVEAVRMAETEQDKVHISDSQRDGIIMSTFSLQREVKRGPLWGEREMEGVSSFWRGS